MKARTYLTRICRLSAQANVSRYKQTAVDGFNYNALNTTTPGGHTPVRDPCSFGRGQGVYEVSPAQTPSKTERGKKAITETSRRVPQQRRPRREKESVQGATIGDPSTRCPSYKSHHTHLELSVFVLGPQPSFLDSLRLFSRLHHLAGAPSLFRRTGGTPSGQALEERIGFRRLRHPCLCRNDAASHSATASPTTTTASTLVPCSISAVTLDLTPLPVWAPTATPSANPKTIWGRNTGIASTTVA